MMYQIVCGHVNYALGKTRMQVKKKQKDTLFWIHVYNMRQVQPETLLKNSNFSSRLQNIKLKNNTT